MMNRREVLQHAAALMGGAISAPALVGVLSGCSPKKTHDGWQPECLTQEQGALISDVVDIMIPRTDTPGAVEIGVPAFVDKMLKDVYGPDDQKRFTDGLAAFTARAQSGLGQSWSKLSPAQRTTLVQQVHDEALQQERADREPDRSSRRPFILMTKELALLGFFTSEPGATQIQQYVAVPGALHACIPLSQAGNGKTWAPENTARF
jgi:hypothetical protein